MVGIYSLRFKGTIPDSSKYCSYTIPLTITVNVCGT
jgi:hypothetical protein